MFSGIRNSIFITLLVCLFSLNSVYTISLKKAERILALLRAPASVSLNRNSSDNADKMTKIISHTIRASHEIITLINHKNEFSLPNACHISTWLAFDLYELFTTIINSEKKIKKLNNKRNIKTSEFKDFIRDLSSTFLPLIETFLALKVINPDEANYKEPAAREKLYSLLSLLRNLYEYSNSDNGSTKEKITISLIIANIASYYACMKRYENAQPSNLFIQRNNNVSEQYNYFYKLNKEGKRAIYRRNKQTKILTNGSDQCNICIDDFNENNEQRIAILNNCGHVFHNNCANNWLRNHNTCPNCRANNDIQEVVRKNLSEIQEQNN